jgi:nicotinate-nucleotide adenylyltransferase
VQRTLGLAELRLVPARDPPHRGAPAADARHRLAMLELALPEFPELSIDTRELARTGKSYTVTTLEELRREMPQRPLVLVVGADAFAGFPTWHRWEELFDLAHVAVVTRPGVRLEDALQGRLLEIWRNRHVADRVQLETAPAGGIYAVAVTPQPISATAIREALGRGGAAAIRGMLPAAVLAYIGLHQLYRPPPDAN